VFEGSLADVSVLAGLLVEKFLYHLPLDRQHRRLADAGVTLSRSTLIHYVQRGIALLRPIYDAQWRHLPQSRVLAMDDKFAGSEFGQLQP
jgi:transposase